MEARLRQELTWTFRCPISISENKSSDKNCVMYKPHSNEENLGQNVYLSER